MPYKDPAKKAEYMKKYQQENKDKLNEYNRLSREKTNRKERDKERYANDEQYRQKVLQKNRENAKKHREKRVETQRIKRQEKRKMLIEHLGGKCVGCGTTESLQFDHLDRTQKTFTISKKLDYSLDKLIPEVEKCQLLCNNCHELKSLINHDKDKLAEGYRVTKVDKMGDKIIVILEPST
jgi:hypothetical protein